MGLVKNVLIGARKRLRKCVDEDEGCLIWHCDTAHACGLQSAGSDEGTDGKGIQTMTQNRDGMEIGVVNQERQEETGQTVKLDLDKLPTHLLLSGTVGSGKSVTIAYALRALMADPERKIGVLPPDPAASTETGSSGMVGTDASDGSAEHPPASADGAGCPK